MKRQRTKAGRSGSHDYAWAGWMLMLGGVFSLTANGLVTPLLPRGAEFAETASSSVFVIRQSLSAVAAMFLTLGVSSLSGLIKGRQGFFARLVTLLAIVGGLLLFAHEWGQIFLVHDLALVAPDALNQLEDQTGLSPFDIGAIAAIVGFSSGWFLYALFLASVATLPRRGSLLVMAGFFAIPALTPLLPGLTGMAVGNLILSSGWVLIGYDTRQRQK